jgi:hypothetical protein
VVVVVVVVVVVDAKLRKDFINQLPYPLVPAHT